jgi:hypothetical protein
MAYTLNGLQRVGATLVRAQREARKGVKNKWVRDISQLLATRGQFHQKMEQASNLPADGRSPSAGAAARLN